jgi:hypothetical protein
MTVKEFCEEYGITEEQFFGKEKINDYLNLPYVTSIPEGFNPTVGGWLDLRSLTSIPEGFNPTVGGSLLLNSLTSIPEGFNPTVGGSLDLSLLKTIPEGFNPTVGGYLDLNSLTSIPEGFNPIVGGGLYLRSLTSIPEGFNPTVGGSLYLKEGLSCEYNKLPKNYMFSWQNEKYIKVDGIFTEVVSKKGNVWKVKLLNTKNEFYLISDGEKYVHGDTLKEAKEDLIFKIANRTKEDYKELKLDSVLSIEEGIVCYRVITGACSFGVKDFMQNRMKDKKKEYSISEIIEMTEGEYGGNIFKKFFNNCL